MKKVLFLDRDGTLILEPPVDFQVDTLEKLTFYPRVFRNLYKIQQSGDYELVIFSNQDGLGTAQYPVEAFERVQGKMLEAFANEDVAFNDIFIDVTLPEEHAPTRKPGTALLEKYLNGDYDLSNSWVVGDRITDVELARNLGCKAILMNDESMRPALEEKGLSAICVAISKNWDKVYELVILPARHVRAERVTSETQIGVSLNLDGSGQGQISTGLGFLDHMLEQIKKHSGCDLNVDVKGDLQVDEHHTIEDTAIVLGEAFNKALGAKAGIQRYGFCLPMDDCLAQVAIDFGGRGWLEWGAAFKREKVGDVPTEMFYHFFKSFTDGARCNLNIKAEGENEHHKIEAIFKALARAIRMAVKRDAGDRQLPSTKGAL